MNRSKRMAIAQETVKIVQQGHYELKGKRIDIRNAIAHCVQNTKYFSPAEMLAMRDEVLAKAPASFKTEIEVVNETTLAGLAHLSSQSNEPVAVLNFASAKNPGGGFLNGSEAQEESLARCSALHTSLISAFDFYELHRNSSSCLYSDAMILSPACPVFRDDDGSLLREPLLAGFLTSPAPNAAATASNHPHELPRVPQVLQSRAELVLALAAAHGYSQLVLGAWGCGVFRNDPELVAQAFASHLLGKWSGRFRKVRFSVLDRSSDQANLAVFKKVFQKSIVA